MRVPVANVAFDNVTMSEAVNRIVQMAQKTDIPRYVCTGNLDHLVRLASDDEFLKVYLDADLVLADGAPVVWLSRLTSADEPLKARVTGSDLFWELGRASSSIGIRLFFLGGAPEAADRAADAVRARHPGAVVCGTYCPDPRLFALDREQAKIREVVREAQPDILLVGFGAPKQEKWIVANKSALGVPVSIGVGGSFEMASGMVRRAPVWAQNSGLEWAYRLIQEPSRLWRRYLLRDLPFLMTLTARCLMTRTKRRTTEPQASLQLDRPVNPRAPR